MRLAACALAFSMIFSMILSMIDSLISRIFQISRISLTKPRPRQAAFSKVPQQMAAA